MALRLTPEWADVRARVDLDESDDTLRADLGALAAATRQLCGRMRSLHLKLDLEDTRRSI